MALSLILAIGLFFLLIVWVLGFLYYYKYYYMNTQEYPCTLTYECPDQSICKDGGCKVRLCTSDKECQKGRCIAGYCELRKCQTSLDCPDQYGCHDGRCYEAGQPCTKSDDCQGFECIQGRCGNCNVNDDCSLGEACIDKLCMKNINGISLDDRITYKDGDVCPISTCGKEPKPCTKDTKCPDGCGYCVDGLCKCLPGELQSACIVNTDCKSGKCTDHVCVVNDGGCSTSKDCSGDTPYCVSGACSSTIIGATCQSGADCFSGGMYYCVNGTCAQEPGSYGDLCVDDMDCTGYYPNPLVCQSVTVRGQTLKACMPGLQQRPSIDLRMFSDDSGDTGEDDNLKDKDILTLHDIAKELGGK